MDEPLVSVVIPFYSEVQWLQEAVDSVTNQTYSNIEILIINDGSNVDICSIFKDYQYEIKVVNQENAGPASARNTGIENALGKYIAFLDSDDIWKPEKLAYQIRFMEEKECSWSQHSYEMFWENNNKTKVVNTGMYSGEVYKDCFISFKVQTSCVVVRKDVLKGENIRFPTEKRYGQDIAFYKKIAVKHKLCYVDGVFSKFRIRGNNAGFRAWVQINDKSNTWSELKQDSYSLNLLPKPIILSYKVLNIYCIFLKMLNKKLLKKEQSLEVVSKIFYVVPYYIFKIYSRKNSKW